MKMHTGSDRQMYVTDTLIKVTVSDDTDFSRTLLRRLEPVGAAVKRRARRAERVTVVASRNVADQEERGGEEGADDQVDPGEDEQGVNTQGVVVVDHVGA